VYVAYNGMNRAYVWGGLQHLVFATSLLVYLKYLVSFEYYRTEHDDSLLRLMTTYYFISGVLMCGMALAKSKSESILDRTGKTSNVKKQE